MNKIFRHEHSTAGVSLSRAIVVTSGDKNILHPCKHHDKKKTKSLQFCPNVDFDKTFSGDDSVTLPDSTQPEEPVSKTQKRKKNIAKMQNSCFKGFELQGEGLHPINLRRGDVHLREDNRTLSTHSQVTASFAGLVLLLNLLQEGDTSPQLQLSGDHNGVCRPLQRPGSKAKSSLKRRSYLIVFF